MVGLFENVESEKLVKLESVPKCGKCPFKKLSKNKPVKLSKNKEILCIVPTQFYIDNYSDILEHILGQQYKNTTFATLLNCNISYSSNRYGGVDCNEAEGTIKKAISCCVETLHSQIYTNSYKIIIVCGKELKELLNYDYKSSSPYSSLVHNVVSSRYYKSVITILDNLDKYCEKNTPDLYLDKARSAFRVAIKKSKKHIEKFNSNKYVDILNGKNAIDYIRYNIDSKELMAFDYETNGLYPYGPGFYIYTIGMCNNKDKAVSFLVEGSKYKEKLLKYWSLFLKSTTPKIIQNVPYEYIFTKKVLGVQLCNIAFDTMIGAHVLDNSQGIVGLKYQTYINFGIGDYSAKVEKYLSTKDTPVEGEAPLLAKNIIYKAPVNEVLKYNALDALFTFILALKQLKKIPIEINNNKSNFYVN